MACRCPKSYVLCTHSFLTWDKSPKTPFSRGNSGLPSLVRSHESLLSLGPPLHLPQPLSYPQGIFVNERFGENRDLVCKTCASGTFSDILRDGPLALSRKTTVFQLGIRQRRGKS